MTNETVGTRHGGGAGVRSRIPQPGLRAMQRNAAGLARPPERWPTTRARWWCRPTGTLIQGPAWCIRHGNDNVSVSGPMLFQFTSSWLRGGNRHAGKAGAGHLPEIPGEPKRDDATADTEEDYRRHGVRKPKPGGDFSKMLRRADSHLQQNRAA